LHLPQFDSRDRADVICSLYETELKKNNQTPRPEEVESHLQQVRHLFVRLDSHALLRCRQPYFDHLREARKQWDSSTAKGRRALLDQALYRQVPFGFRDKETAPVPGQAVIAWYLFDSPELPTDFIKTITEHDH